MTVDKGGLDYPIIVRDQFGKNLDRFKQKTDAARASWAALKRETKDAGSAAGAERLQRTVSETQRTLDRSAASATRLSAQTRQLTRQEENRQRALNRLNREARKRETLEAAALTSSRRQFQYQRQLASATRARASAEEQITRTLDRKLQKEQLYRALQERGLSQDKRLRAELGLQTAAEQRLARAQAQRRSVVNSLRRTQQEASNERLRQLKAEAQAQAIINRANIRTARDNALRAAGRPDLVPGFRPTEAPLTFFQRLSAALSDSDNKANRVAFTFRRLFGILAAFTIARQAVAGFVNSIRTLIQASAQIESTTLGIASILTSVGDIRNTSGEAVDAVEGLTIAQAEARRQTQLLRKDALATVATFEELVEAFQVGLAPGLRAGLDVDQVRVFTRQISLAASAIGLEQRQLAEEIRSILSGTINLRQTRIAAALGITNEEIRQAREAGELFEFLQDRFRGFDAAGALAADTFTGLVGRVRDGFRLLLAEGGVTFFEQLKDTLRETLGNLQTIDTVTGQLTLNPALLAAVSAFSQGLAQALQEIVALVGSLSDSDFISFATEAGQTFALVARTIRLIVQGVVVGVRRAGSLLLGLRSLASDIAGALGIDLIPFENLLSLLFQIVAIATIINTTFFLLSLPVKAVVLAVGTLLSVLKAVQAAIVGIRVAVVAVQATLGPIHLAVVLITAAVIYLAYRLGLLDRAIESVASTATSALDKTQQAIEGLVGKTIQTAQDQVLGFVLSTSNAIDKIQEKVASLFDEISQIRDVTGTELALTATSFNFESPFTRLAVELSNAKTEAGDLIREANKEISLLGQVLDDLQEKALSKAQELQREFGDVSLDSLLETEAEDRRILTEYADLIRRINDLRNRGTSVLFTEEDRQARILELTKQRIRLEGVALRAAADREQIRAGSAATLQEYSNIQGLITANEDKQFQIKQAINDIEGQLLSKAIARLRLDAQTSNNSLREENARLRIASIQERELAIATVRGDEASQRLIVAQREAALLQFNNAVENEGIRNAIEKVQLSLELTRSRIDELRALEASGDILDNQKIALEEALAFEQELLRSRELLNDQLDLSESKFEAQNLVLQEQLRLQEFAKQNPIGAAFVDGIAESFAQASDLFSQFRELFIGGVNELAATISKALVDAFDPSTDTSIRERFATFLRGLAQQIIQTLLQIALTAVILNALSGGILGATIGSFASNALGRGFVDGGEITHDRTKRKAARARLSHSRARGFAHGGMPGRPKNLHPKDTIPIWAAAGEFVVRAKSTAKAGYDAMARINEGSFNTTLLRAAVGLGTTSPATAGAVAAARGPGFVDGGRIAAQAATRQSGSTAPGLAVAAVAPSNENFARLLEGGLPAMLEFFSDHPDEIRARLGI